jgi:acyl dehydratase
MNGHRLRAKNLSPESDNKIHDDEVARKFGFVGALVPGVEVFAYATRPFAAEWGEEFLHRGVIDVRFHKPVYDGDDVDVTAAADGNRFAVTLTGPDGVVRATGHAGLAHEDLVLDAGRFQAGELPDPPPPADATTLAVGTHLGTAREPVTEESSADYRRGVSDDLPLYDRYVHPGLLLRAVNAALYRSVALGPWIHTASSCRLLAPAPVPTTLVARGVVTDRFDKNGRARVRYDALVLADDRPVMVVDHEAIYDLGAG